MSKTFRVIARLAKPAEAIAVGLPLSLRGTPMNRGDEAISGAIEIATHPAGARNDRTGNAGR